ncbi:YheT family hydrolase [Holophaga foetida]|uniref:YheT family hydrolase n=1 Tax=Holophaga foetida TaxID=35839 RepID=UPI0002471C68|nr:alpha/beta fold hydrolase [Holophaga foetida]
MNAPEPFVPPRWARWPHVQTILAHLIPSPTPESPWRAESLSLADGDRLALRIWEGCNSTVLFLFHGLAGSADADYMRRTVALGLARGWTVVAVNHRGSGEGRGMARRTYHSGATGDLAAVLAWGRERWPGHRHLAVGFSISANMLLLLVGRDQHLAQPDLAIAVNPPGDLEAASRRLRQGFNRVYDLRFVKRLRRLAEELGGRSLPPTATLWDFDEVYTAQAAGFRDRLDYYTRCSCGSHLAGIRTPTVILTSEDDPFAPASDLGPVSPAVRLHVERSGGHMGYWAARPTPLGSRRWLDYALEVCFRESYLSTTSRTGSSSSS